MNRYYFRVFVLSAIFALLTACGGGSANESGGNESSGDVGGGDEGGTRQRDPGAFIDSGQELGASDTSAIVLGDVDGDGDLDMVACNYDQLTRIYLNDGAGNYTDSGQRIAEFDYTLILIAARG